MTTTRQAATTPAGGWDISPAPAGPAPSREDRSTAGATGVVEQRTADDSPPFVGSDEIIDFDLIMGLALTAEEARTLYEFLGDAARIWGRADA